MGESQKTDDLYRLIDEIFQNNGKLLAEGDRLCAGKELTGARWQVLGALQLEDRPLTVAQIARRMGLQRQSVQRLADIMVKQNILAYLPNPEHKRAKLVELTDAGRDILDHLCDSKCQWAEGIVSDFSRAELQQTIDVLQRLREKLDSSTEI
jgi:DNA-binding MarR family transcriptional regulator